MKRVLFVDDEPRVLAGLRRMLCGMRHEWEMEFVADGQEALDRLAAVPVDIVLTDMRMPGMDGAQLLEHIVIRYPGTIRVILSGQCEREAVFKTIGPAHQFLTKPCDSEKVKTTLSRACKLRDRLVDEPHRQLVSRIRSIPCSPTLYAEFVAELSAAQPSTQRIGQIVMRDIGLAIKLVQLVNSGFFGSPQEVLNPARAAELLGIDILKEITLSIGIFQPFAQHALVGNLLELLLEHSLNVARGARAIVRTETGDTTLANAAYLAGLLHDVGLLLLAENAPERFAETLRPAREEQTSVWDIETSHYAVTHADMGGYLLGLWGLPDFMVDMSVFHHRPSLSNEASFGVLTAVHVANSFAQADEIGLDVAALLDREHLTRTGCSGRIDTWKEAFQAAIFEEVSVP